MAMRIAPPSSHTTTHQTTSLSAPSAPGLHDTLRSGLGPSPFLTSLSTPSTSLAPTSNHPLEARLLAWTSTQETLKMEGLRRTFGIAEPIRRQMELKIVKEGEWKPMCLGGGLERGVHEDILMGSDNGCEWEDVFKGEESRGVVGFHEEVERKVRMGN